MEAINGINTEHVMETALIMYKMSTRLEKALEKHHMSVQELSRITGISKIQINRFLNGFYIPTHSMSCAIAKALHVSVHYLLGGDESSVSSADESDTIDEQKLNSIVEHIAGPLLKQSTD